MVRVREGLLQLEDMPVLARRGGGDDSGSAHPFEHALDHSPRMEHDNSRDQPHRRQFSVELVGGAAQPHPDAHGQAEEMGGEVLGRNGAQGRSELQRRIPLGLSSSAVGLVGLISIQPSRTRDNGMFGRRQERVK